MSCITRGWNPNLRWSVSRCWERVSLRTRIPIKVEVPFFLFKSQHMIHLGLEPTLKIEECEIHVKQTSRVLFLKNGHIEM